MLIHYNIWQLFIDYVLPVASTISIVDYTRAAQVCKSTITDFNKYVFDFEMLTFAPQEHTAVVDAEALVDFLLFLRLSEHYGMCTLTDIVSADAIDERKRFIVLYRLVNHESSAAIVAATATCEGDPIPTVASIFSSAVWAEREVWEMHGVYFLNHPDLRRLLTDTNFDGHPLRKDFPAVGYYEAFFSTSLGAIEMVKVELMQEFRVFEFHNYWESGGVYDGDNFIDSEDVWSDAYDGNLVTQETSSST